MKFKLRALCAAVALLLACLAPQLAFAQAALLPNAKQCFQATTGLTGFVGTLGTISGGYGGSSGFYGGVALTGGTGTGATANITVTGGTVTAVAMLSPGVGYVVGDTLSASPSAIGGTTGFSVPVSSVSINSSLAGGTVGMYTPGTLTFKQTYQNSSETILNTNPIQLDQNGCALIYGVGTYRQILYDSLGNEVWDQLTNVNPQVSSTACSSSGGVSLSVYSNTQLEAVASTTAPCVQRFGYSTLGDSPPVFYAAQSTCPYNGGTADGGSCVTTADGKFWVLQQQPVLDTSEWGVKTSNTDNGPYFQYAFNYIAVNGGQALLTTGAGTFTVASTFTCANASGWTWKGTGNSTLIYRTGNYGSTFTCGDSTHYPQSIRIADMWFRHYIGIVEPAVPANFVNPTTNSAHFDFINVSHFVFDHVTEWDLNFGFRIIQCIDGTWIDPLTSGYWDGTNDQTVADFYFDGQDGTGLGHPQIMKIHDPLLQGYNRPYTITFTSGSVSRTVSSSGNPYYNQELSAFDHIKINSMEGFEMDDGYGLSGAFDASLHIQPQGVTGKPISQIMVNNVWFDGAGIADALIENFAQSNCSNPNVSATNVQINNSILNGELSSLYNVQVPNYTCTSVSGLYLGNDQAFATVKNSYYIGGANGGNIIGGSAKNYNVWGVYANDQSASSAAYLFGQTANFDTNSIKVGGDNTYANPPDNTVGVASVYAAGTGYGTSVSGTMTWAGSGCATNPVLNVTTTSGGAISSVASIATAGVCSPWPPISATTWTAGGGLSAGSGASFALAPPYAWTNQSIFGVSIAGGLVGVTRENISNGGYYEDFPSGQVACTVGTGSPTYSPGFDNRHGTVTSLSSSGSVTSATCAFNGALLASANVTCHVTDAFTSGGTPVAARAYSSSYSGFNATFASSIGGGGSFSYQCDATN